MDVQITVASKTPGAEGKPTSKITDTTGKTWYVYNNVFGQFQVGLSYIITKYKTSDFKGSTYYYVDAFTPVGGAAARPTPNGGVATTAGNSYRPQVDPSKTDNERRMDIFICGAFNNMMANPNVHPLELDVSQKAAIVNGLRQVWLTTLGPNRPSQISTSATRMENQPTQQTINPDMNDSIPF